eukprot:4124188-Prymnesium_polylepis.3
MIPVQAGVGRALKPCVVQEEVLGVVEEGFDVGPRQFGVVKRLPEAQRCRVGGARPVRGCATVTVTRATVAVARLKRGGLPKPIRRQPGRHQKLNICCGLLAARQFAIYKASVFWPPP